jgi:mono/diheme cytochrome c family protein
MRRTAIGLLAGALGVWLPVASSAAETPLTAHSRRGGSVVLDREALVAYAADADNAALHRVDLLSGSVVSTPLGCAPEQVVLLGEGRVAVSLRACNRVDLLELDAAGEGRVTASAEVAPDPWGLAATPDGSLLVTSAWGHTLTGLDGRTLARRFAVDTAREPRGVAVTADGRRAFITHAVGDAVTVVDLAAVRDAGAASSARADGAAPALAPVRRVRALGARYRNRVDHAFNAGTLHPSASGAFAAVINDAGTRLFVPHLAVQNGAESSRMVFTSYGGVPVDEDTSLASVAVIGVRDEEPLDAHLPARTGPGHVQVNGDPRGTFAVAPGGAPCRQARAAAIAGDLLYVTSFGTGELVELDARSLDPAMSPRRTFAVGDGPSGVEVDAASGVAVVWNQHSHDLSIVSLASGGVERIPVAGDPLPPEIAAGRRLFHTERDPRISRDGRACAGCHPDGRDDGLVWKLGAGPRQTMMLAGRVDEGPYGWVGLQPSMEDNLTVTMHRLGGGGLPKERVAELAAFVQRGLRPPTLPPPSPEAAAKIARGRVIFGADEAGCAGCHALDHGGSDHAPHNVGSRSKTDHVDAFRTPPLRFVAGTAPYFHDGRYATLEALLDDNLDRMGSTSQLSRDDRDALLAFLRTL